MQKAKMRLEKRRTEFSRAKEVPAKPGCTRGFGVWIRMQKTKISTPHEVRHFGVVYERLKNGDFGGRPPSARHTPEIGFSEREGQISETRAGSEDDLARRSLPRLAAEVEKD